MLRDLPEDQRPREKLAKHSAAALSDSELIAIFLRTGTKGQSALDIAQRLLASHRSLTALSRLDHLQLSEEHGLGPAKAAQLAAAFEIGSRLARESATSAPLKSAQRIYDIMAPQLLHLPTEHLVALLCDAKLNHTQTVTISKGGISSTSCTPREVLRPVILRQAHSFFLVHNHPSGDPSPSIADISVTSAIRDAAALMQIRLVDHIIIGQRIHGKSPYYSFRENNKLG